MQRTQKLIRRKLRVVQSRLPKPSQDLPHSILPKFSVTSVVEIVYGLEPVWNGTCLDITGGAS